MVDLVAYIENQKALLACPICKSDRLFSLKVIYVAKLHSLTRFIASPLRRFLPGSWGTPKLLKCAKCHLAGKRIATSSF